ncbi:RF-1 domain-containing protein [Colletotrichum sublineola]|uniref:Putative RF-1 domain-containing protein n=1 Tax=Colletotrichum sublineola TaxID=1173701 RepID=A0A066X5S7_COLSU|nr:RF-1 domain-containing protein [Colletotrichum sublineola]KDN63034.1 putative RF-1 domain-containing protein [Colletotrichum sublineola]
MPPPLTLLSLLPRLAGAANANAFMRCRCVTARPALMNLQLQHQHHHLPLVAPFSASPAAALKKHEMPPRPKPPPDSEIEESYLKGSGPGGQKINKTSSAVQLKHIPTGVVVKSQATRSRTQNRKIAREILAQKLDDLQNGDQSRSAIVGEVKRKKAASAAKKSKRKYRQLEEEKAQNETSEVEVKEQQHAEDQTNSAPSALDEPATSTEANPHVQNLKP